MIMNFRNNNNNIYIARQITLTLTNIDKFNFKFIIISIFLLYISLDIKYYSEKEDILLERLYQVSLGSNLTKLLLKRILNFKICNNEIDNFI